MKSTPAFLLRVFEELEDFNGEFYQEFLYETRSGKF